MDNPYLALTEAFNRGRLRALLSSGQAVVVHRLAMMSKDGDWILREDPEATAHVLEVLDRRGARYRFGAPLDVRWLAGGWSSHFEYRADGLRVRTDLVSRPPRITPVQLTRIWEQAEATIPSAGLAVVGLEPLAAIKLTNREKDYAVVGELARRMTDPRAQLLFSRSARDLLDLARAFPADLAACIGQRPVLAHVAQGREALEEALDRERRALMRANEDRLARYQEASREWSARWPEASRRMARLPLAEAHAVMVKMATGVLPESVEGQEASP